MRGLLLSLVVLLTIGVFFVIENNKVPSNIGIHNGRLSELKKSDNGVSSQTSQLGKKVAPLVLYDEIVAKELLIEAFNDCGNYEINMNTDTYMHVIFISDTMKFKDDLEILIDLESSTVHYRSESRVGYSDMGVNLERYNKISKYYNGKLSELEK